MSEDRDNSESANIETIRQQIEKASPSTRRRIFEKFFLAAMGSIPWVGGFITAAAELKLEGRDIEEDSLQTMWLEEHAVKLGRLQSTLEEIALRFENIGESIDERVESEEYLDLVRRAFRSWDRAIQMRKESM